MAGQWWMVVLNPYGPLWTDEDILPQQLVDILEVAMAAERGDDDDDDDSEPEDVMSVSNDEDTDR